MFDVKNCRVIITGAAQGFGKEFAKRLLQKNCKICLSDINEIKGLETKAEFQKVFDLDDNSLCFIKCDVADKDAWDILWNEAERKLEGPIDILINNAGLNHLVCTLVSMLCCSLYVYISNYVKCLLTSKICAYLSNLFFLLMMC